MAGMTDLLVVGAVLLAGYYIYTHPEILSQLTGGLHLGEQQQESVVQSNGETDIEVSGEGAGACANGRCEGSPEAVRRAEELLEQIS